MRKHKTFLRCLHSVVAVGLALAGSQWTAPVAATELTDAEAAVKKAEKADDAAYTELDSRAMTHAATREIARAEQRRAEDALRKLLAAREILEQKIAGKSPQTEVAAAREFAVQKLDTMRLVADRLMADSFAHDEAAQVLIAAQNKSRREGGALRAAEGAVLKLKAAAAEKPRADAARRAVFENQALTAWENQLWAEEQAARMRETVGLSETAAKIATALAAAEPDPERKKILKQFARTETERKVTMAKLVAAKKAEFAAATARVFPPRTAALGGLNSLNPEDWDYAKARHLLVRAGFGGTPAEVEKLRAMGPHKAVDHLLLFYKQAPAAGALDIAQPLPPDPFEKKLRHRFLKGRAASVRKAAESGQASRLRRWWLQRMVESPRPLEEKLTLFWHGLFAAQNSVVSNSYTMYKQNEIFREHAAGNYGAMLYAIIHDPAMIRYLDNNKNVKGEPNENLAREIMELFSMGVGQGYTEEDVIEAARALTGYTFDNRSGGFRFIQAKHDTGDKTIFGKTGPWTGDDLVRLILEQPATSRFIARRLYEYFAGLDPEQQTVERLAAVLRASRYDLEPVLRNLFLSEDFYGERVIGGQIKSPVELVVGTLRDMGVKKVSNYGALDTAIRQMGQQLLEPPDVKGWRYGRTWISSNRLFVRYNTVAELIDSVPRPKRRGIDGVAILRASGSATSAELVDYLARTCLMKPLSQEKQKELVDFLGVLPKKSDWEKQGDELNEKLQSLLVLMLSTPEYQMN